MIPPSAELLLEWDAQRPRSLQAELGISDLGRCRRKAGYILAGEPRENGHKSLQPVLGTAVHELIREIVTGKYIAGSRFTERTVRFAGVTGHADLYWSRTVRDVKTVGRVQQLDRIKVHGPPKHDLWQVNTYAAAIIAEGKPVERVQLDYIARDSGDTWLWEDVFRIEHVRDAMAWLRTVQDTELEFLARDYRPDSPHCTSCPFRRACWEDRAVDGRSPLSVLYVDEPDAEQWLWLLEDAKARREAAEDDEARAKGALDALRPNDSGTAEIAVPNCSANIRFTVVKGRTVPDADRIREDYARAGGVMPEITGEPHVRVSLVAKRDT